MALGRLVATADGLAALAAKAPHELETLASLRVRSIRRRPPKMVREQLPLLIEQIRWPF